MKTITLLIALIALTFLSACQKNGQNNTPIPGPSDGGGGDTCNGKMIESYRVDITQLEEYKELLQPILDKTADSKDPKGAESSPFFFGAKAKNWYLIDCKLQEIPKERKGLYLETYQTAVHTGREIFIDANSYKTMAKEEKAKLLLHEMVMAYYLVKYLSLEDLCKMSTTCSNEFPHASKWKMFRPEAYRPLNEADHQKIRNVTAWLWQHKDDISTTSFKNLLKTNDFDKRFFQAIDEDLQEIQLDPQVLVRALKKYEWSQSFPQFCGFNNEVLLSQSTCKASVQADIHEREFAPFGKVRELRARVRILRETDKKVVEKEFSLPLYGDGKINLSISNFGGFLRAGFVTMMSNWPGYPGYTGGPEPEEGLKSQMLLLMLGMANKENPEIYKIDYNTYVWYEFKEEEGLKDGVKFKNLYGYNKLLEAESETLFFEKELPFQLIFKMDPKTLIRGQEIP